MRIVFVPRDASLCEGELYESEEAANSAAQQWAQDLADNWQESVGCYYEIVILNKDVNSLEELDEDERCDEIEQCYIEANPIEPPCDRSVKQHDWLDNNDVVGHGGGVTLSQTCSLCGYTKLIDTWHDNGYGDPIDWIAYVPPDPDEVPTTSTPDMSNSPALDIDQL